VLAGVSGGVAWGTHLCDACGVYARILQRAGGWVLYSTCGSHGVAVVLLR
jgi:hypothetical protein